MKKIFAIVMLFLFVISNYSLGLASEDYATREYLIHKFVRITGMELKNNEVLSEIKDVNEIDENYRNSLAMAVENKWVNGYEDKTLKPKNFISRIEAFSILSRIIPKTVFPPANAREAFFADVPQWAKADIELLTKLELVKGYEDGTIGANDKITKEQVNILVNRLKKYFDLRVQDDFYSMINKEWLATTDIPYYSNSVSTFFEVSNIAYSKYNYSYNNLKNMVLDNDRTQFSNYMSSGTGSINRIELNFVLDILNKINSASNMEEFTIAVAEAQRDFFVPSIVNLGVSSNPTNRDIGALYIVQPNLFLNDDIYFNGEKAEGIKNTYIEYLTEMLYLLNMQVGTDKEKEVDEFIQSANEIYLMQKEISKYVDTRFTRENIMKSAEGITLWELKSIFSEFDIEKYLSIMEIPQFEKAYSEQKDALNCFSKYLINENLPMLKNYALCSLLHYYSGSIDQDDFYRTYDKFYNSKLTEQPVSQKKSDSVTDYRYEKNKEKIKYVEEIFVELKAIYKEQIETSPYFSNEYKNEVVKKLDNMKIIIGENPVGYYKWFEEYLDNATPFNENYKRYNDMVKFINKKIFSQVNNKMIYNELTFEAGLVNAFYNRLNNTIAIPFGILEDPFYSEFATKEENLAGIGFVIGHELGHSIDYTASVFDSNGNIRNYLTKEDDKHFNGIKEQLVNQFSSYEIKGIGKIDGFYTLDENLCDILSMNCIVEYAKEKNYDIKAIFESYPIIWREKGYIEFYETNLLNNQHSPGKFRVNGVLGHIEEFYKIYNLEEGDNLYLLPNDRISLY